MNYCHPLRSLLVLACCLYIGPALAQGPGGYTPQPGPDGGACEDLVCGECRGGYTFCRLETCGGFILGDYRRMACAHSEDGPIILNPYGDPLVIEEEIIREYERNGGPAIDPMDPDFEEDRRLERPGDVWQQINPDAAQPQDLLGGPQPQRRWDLPGGAGGGGGFPGPIWD